MRCLDKKLRSALDKVHAGDALIERTAARLADGIDRRSRKCRAATRFRPAVACVAALLIVVLSGISLNLYFTPSAYIDMDVNPSIGLTTNLFGRVIVEQAYNDDGARILAAAPVRHMDYHAALDALIDAMRLDGCLQPGGLVSVTVQAGDETLLQGVRTSVDASLSARRLAAETDVFAVSEDTRATAGAHQLSPAMYLAITELQQVDPNATIAGCRNHSIRELRQSAHDHAGAHASGSAAPKNPEDAATPAPTAQKQQTRQQNRHGNHHGGGH